jgi:hypothetical protein
MPQRRQTAGKDRRLSGATRQVEDVVIRCALPKHRVSRSLPVRQWRLTIQGEGRDYQPILLPQSGSCRQTRQQRSTIVWSQICHGPTSLPHPQIHCRPACTRCGYQMHQTIMHQTGGNTFRHPGCHTCTEQYREGVECNKRSCGTQYHRPMTVTGCQGHTNKLALVTYLR